MNFSPESKFDEGPIPEGEFRKATPEEIEQIEEMEEFYETHPYKQE